MKEPAQLEIASRNERTIKETSAGQIPKGKTKNKYSREYKYTRRQKEQLNGECEELKKRTEKKRITNNRRENNNFIIKFGPSGNENKRRRGKKNVFK